jgi:hypothetical protein
MLFHETSWEPLKKTYRSYFEEDPPVLIIKDYTYVYENAEAGLFWDFMDRLSSFSDVPIDTYFYKSLNERLREIYPQAKIPRTEILAQEFAGRTGIVSVVIPKGVTSIGTAAFWGCTRLESVTIPNSVTSIGREAFSRCTSLESITIPNSVTSIGYEAFSSCTSLESITIPNSVTSIGELAFWGCTSLESITIPNSVTSIGYEAFSGCTNLKSITLGSGAMRIGASAFANCTSLESITIPDSVTSIGYGAFEGAHHSFTIYGKAGSTAESHARANNIPFIIGTPEDPQAPRLDTASEWARDGITAATSKGFVPAGIQNNYTNTITRAEFCRMAVKWVEYALGKPIAEIVVERGIPERMGHTFSDTSDASILAAYRLGITSGTSATTFNPNGQFTREQAATMIMNTAKAIGADVSNPPAADFSDMNAAAGWAHPGIDFVRANGIMSGSGGNFNPAGMYTRQESIITFNNIKHNELPGR